MSEVEKLYKNAGFIKKQCKDYSCPVCEQYNECDKYPPFTPDKQLLLLQWLLDKTDLYLHRHKTDFTYSIASGDYAVNKYKDFKESVAEFINAIWQDLTESEQEQIRSILNG